MAKSKEQITREAVIFELERQSLLLDSDPELIHSLSVEDVNTELLDIGLEPKPLPENIRQLIATQTGRSAGTITRPSSSAARTVGAYLQSAKAAWASFSNINDNDEEWSELKQPRIPLLLSIAAILALTVIMTPLVHDLVVKLAGNKLASEALGWIISFSSAVLPSTLVVFAIGHIDPSGRRTTINRAGMIVGVALSVGLGLLWLRDAAGPTEKLFAAAITMIEMGTLLVLERFVSVLRIFFQEQAIPQVLPTQGGWALERRLLGINRVVTLMWAKTVGVVVLVSLAILPPLGWRYFLPPQIASASQYAVVIDRSLSLSTKEADDAIACLATSITNLPPQTVTIRYFATGDAWTANEPILLGTYQIPKLNHNHQAYRALEGRNETLPEFVRRYDPARLREALTAASRIRYDELGATSEAPALGVRYDELGATSESPIYLALERAADELRSSSNQQTESFLWVVTDGEETVNSDINSALTITAQQTDWRAKLPAPIDNTGIYTIFVGTDGPAVSTTETDQTHRNTERLHQFWSALFTHPELVSFEPYCNASPVSYHLLPQVWRDTARPKSVGLRIQGGSLYPGSVGPLRPASADSITQPPVISTGSEKTKRGRILKRNCVSL